MRALVHRRKDSLRAVLLPLLCLSALVVPGVSCLQAQTAPTTATLRLSSPAALQGTPVAAVVSIANAAGPVTSGGLVDVYDGSNVIASVQVVTNAAAGNAIGTATLRKLFGPGLHPLSALYRGTKLDATSTSGTQLLTVAGSNAGASTLPVYAGTRDMANGTAYSTLYQSVVADFNNDGVLDAAATGFTAPNVVSIALGDPAHPGQFLAPAFYPIPAAKQIDRIVAVDYDGDGLVDLIVSDLADIEVFLLRNDPAHPGTFLPAQQIDVPPIFTVGQFTGGGLPDLITVLSDPPPPPGHTPPLPPYLSSVTVYANDTANGGTFKMGVTSSIALYRVFDVKPADLNGDGVPDLIVVGLATPFSNFGETIVLFGRPGLPGQFQQPVTFTDVAINAVACDLKGSGVPYLVTVGEAGMTTRQDYTPIPDQFYPSTYYYYYGLTQVACGDFDGDGKLDLVVGIDGGGALMQNQLLLYHGNGDGTLADPVPLTTGPISTAWGNGAISIADLDGDGLPDILTSGFEQNALQIFTHQPPAVTPPIRTATDLASSTSYYIYANHSQVLTATETVESGAPLTGTVEFYDLDNNTPNHSISVLPIVNGQAILSLGNPPSGNHQYVAVYHGDSTHAPSESLQFSTFVEPGGYLTKATLTSAPNPSAFGQPVQFSMLLSGLYGAAISASGTAELLAANQVVATSPVVNNTAMFTLSDLKPGFHEFTAIYLGDQTNDSVSSNNVDQYVSAADSTIVLTVSPYPTSAFTLPVTLTALVTSYLYNPTGYVTFVDGAATIGFVKMIGGNASTQVQLQPGSHILTAIYGGDDQHARTTSLGVNEIITGLPTTTVMNAKPASSIAFQSTVLTAQVTNPNATAAAPGPSLAGPVSFSAEGSPLGTVMCDASGFATLTIDSLPAGRHFLRASYAGNVDFTASSSSIFTENVIPDDTTTTLQLAPNPAFQTQGVTFTSAVQGVVSRHAASGNVSIVEGSTVLGSAQLNAQGVAVGVLKGLSPGTHILNAVYSGDSNFNVSTSPPVSLLIKPDDFTVTPSEPTVTLQTEHHHTLSVAVASIGLFQDRLDFTCIDLPAHATCTFGTRSVYLGPGGMQTDSLTIDTDDVLYYAESGLAGKLTVCLLLGGLGLFGRRRRWHGLLPILLLTAMAALAGCSGKYPAHTAPGTYHIAVEVRGEQSGIVHDAPVTLVVTP